MCCRAALCAAGARQADSQAAMASSLGRPRALTTFLSMTAPGVETMPSPAMAA
jgi:hypothetical protein